MSYIDDFLKEKLEQMRIEKGDIKVKVSKLREENTNPSSAEIASSLGLPEGMKNLDNIDDEVLLEIVRMQKRANQWNYEYAEKTVSGITIANLTDHTVEEVYVQDIEKYDSLALEYHYGIFMSVTYEKIELGHDLNSTRILIKKIELLAGSVENK